MSLCTAMDSCVLPIPLSCAACILCRSSASRNTFHHIPSGRIRCLALGISFQKGLNSLCFLLSNPIMFLTLAAESSSVSLTKCNTTDIPFPIRPLAVPTARSFFSFHGLSSSPPINSGLSYTFPITCPLLKITMSMLLGIEPSVHSH